MAGDRTEPQVAELGLEQELRLAVVLYGGVSLAIYMYGVAQELYNLVWATAPSQSYAKDGEPPETLARARPESTGAVYRELARLLPLGGGGADGPVRTRFVVDIISGTSAGGINGICLAKALAGEADLSELKNIWVTEGDIGKLINDELSEYPEEPPSSLLSGQRMLAKLIGAITGMAGEAEGDSRLVDELDLWVTATDLEGLEIPIQIANATAHERRHANRYHFRYSAVDERNDFDGTADGFIAYAARSTSAFPFAFAPVRLEDLSALGNVPDDAWLRFYSAYASCPRPPFETRSFSDGGILDNKPFSYATQTLLGRHASLPVDRKVLYVEPDPAGKTGEAGKPPRPRWNAIDTSQKALLGLPQMEHIREDVQTVLDRNRTIERVRDIVTNAGGTAPEKEVLDALKAQPTSDDWGDRGMSETAAQSGPAYGVYHQLKVRGVVDYLTALVVRAAGFDPGSDEDFAVHYMVRAWKESRYASEPGGELASENEFLLHFDMPYRLRRLDFLLERIKQLRSSDAKEVERVLRLCGVFPAPKLDAGEREDELIKLRRALADVRRTVRQAERELVSRDLAAAVRELGITREQLTDVLAGRTDEAMLALAQEKVSPERFEAVAEGIEQALEAAAADMRTAVAKALEEPADGGEPAKSLRAALRFAYDTFEAYDLPLYLVQYGTPVGETNPVDIVRISPLDADGPAGAARELRGMRLHHFGAFLDETWRRYDMVWGRLDGAECLIKALIPEDPTTARELVRTAHERILEEYREEVGEQGGNDVFEWFEKHSVSTHPEEAPTTAALNRGAVVVSHLVEDALPAGGFGAKSRQVVGGVRAALMKGDDRPAVDAVMELVRSQRMVRGAMVAWAVALLAGIALVAFGDGALEAAGYVVLGAVAALGAVAIAARVAVGAAVRAALGAARQAAYGKFFPKT